jgi:hypothetical protein
MTTAQGRWPPGKGERNTEQSVMFLPTTHRKEHGMKHGHVTGTKAERKGASEWYRTIEEANIRRIEAEWQAKQTGK